MLRVAIFGAYSGIAQVVARKFAAQGAEIFIVGRSAEKLSIQAGDLTVRGAARVEEYACNLGDLAEQQGAIDTLFEKFARVDHILIAYGVLPEQSRAESDLSYMLAFLNSDFIGTTHLLAQLANRLEQQRSGVLAVITSVAGDRGKASNYLYGSVKGGLSIFAEGLRCRLFKAGVRVVTIKPGFTDTPMTASLKKGPLFASAETVGEGVYKAMSGKADCVYLPWFWLGIMTVICSIPSKIYKRMGM